MMKRSTLMEWLGLCVSALCMSLMLEAIGAPFWPRMLASLVLGVLWTRIWRRVTRLTVRVR